MDEKHNFVPLLLPENVNTKIVFYLRKTLLYNFTIKLTEISIPFIAIYFVLKMKALHADFFKFEALSSLNQLKLFAIE